MGNHYLASKLDLSNQGLSELPNDILRYKNLRKLILSNNKLSSVPIEISQLTKLRLLDLSNNLISDTRAKLFDLTQLDTLILNGNQLKNIPRQIFKLQKLKKFSCSGNQIESLPDEFGRLLALKSLDLSNNSKLTNFPQGILQLTNLETLSLIKSRFRSIPVNELVTNLTKMKRFYYFNPNIEPTRNIDSIIELIERKKGNSIQILRALAENQTSTQTNTTKKMKTNNSKHIFISYSHKETSYKIEIVNSLKGLHYAGMEFSYWVDDQIESGDEFRASIDENLKKADIAIFILSRSFMASKFIQEVELPTLLEKAENENTRFLIVIAQKCAFEDSVLGKYQTVKPNSPNQPLNGMKEHEQDLVYYNLMQDVKRHIGDDV